VGLDIGEEASLKAAIIKAALVGAIGLTTVKEQDRRGTSKILL
jgi:hypothetical protein